MAKLMLSYNLELGRYTLRDQYQSGDCSYEMVIEKESSDEYRYRFLVWEDGEWNEAITLDELRQRIKDVVEHEGEEVAAIWERENTYIVLRPEDPVFKLQRKWEAMMELNLFDIPVTWASWQGKPMSQEALQEMSDARDKWQKEAADEMAAEMEAAERGRK